MCAKSSGAVTNISGEGEFLHELEEKMEVSRSCYMYEEKITLKLQNYIYSSSIVVTMLGIDS